jgi:PAS domain S-box-containing protein
LNAMDNFQGPYLEITKNKQIISNECFKQLKHEIRSELIDSCYEVMETNIPKKYARHIQQSFCDMSILPVTDEHGEVEAAVATGFTRDTNKLLPLFQDFILDNIPIVIFYVEYLNEEYFFRAINKAFLDSTGLKSKDILGKNVREVIPKESHNLVFSNYQKAITSKEIVHWEERSVFPSGVRYGDVSAIPVFDESEHCLGLIGTVHDITDRKIAEIELKKNFNLLNSIVEGTTDAVFIKDLEGRYIMLNSSTAHFHGRRKDEMIGHTDYELTDPEVAVLYSHNDKEVIAKNLTKTYLEEGVLGGRYQCFLSLKAPYKDADGNVIGIIGLSRDITELKDSQRALEKSQEEIESYAIRLKMLSDLSVSFSQAQLDLGKIADIIVNQAALIFHGGAILELLNEHESLEVIRFDHFDPVILEKLQVMPVSNEGYEALFKGETLSTPGYGYRDIGIESVHIVPMKAVERPLGVLKFLSHEKDISKAKLSFLQTFADRSSLAISNASLFKKANDAIQLREDFIQVASHELRTPLTPLKLQIGLLQKFLIREDILSSPQGKELEKILKGADRQVIRLKNLIDDLIDVTKFSMDKISLSLTLIDCLDVIKNSVKEFQTLYPEATIELSIPDDEKIQGNLDINRFKQVLFKLLSNAFQYGLSRPIRVRAFKLENTLVIKVQDSGLGIAPKDQKRIFERFERGLSVNSYGGLGMGLFITKKIIEAHGGKMILESELNKGSTFTVELPVRN